MDYESGRKMKGNGDQCQDNAKADFALFFFFFRAGSAEGAEDKKRGRTFFLFSSQGGPSRPVGWNSTKI